MSTQPVIIIIGRSHAGKTTFARRLKKKLVTLVVIETDPIAIFLKEQFPEVAQFDDGEHTGAFKNVSLKFRIFENVLDSALLIDAPIILSNANIWKESRRLIIEKSKAMGRPTIGIFINLPSEVLKERARVSERDARVLRTSLDFVELIDKQESRLQIPQPEEFDTFFDVKSEVEYDRLLLELQQKLS